MFQDRIRWKEGFYRASWWAFLAMVFIIPFPLPSWIGNILILWLSVFLLIKLAFREFRVGKDLWFLAAFLVAVLLSCLFSINLDKSMTYFREDMFPISVIYLSASQLLTGRKRLLQLSLALMASFTVATCVSFGHYGHRNALYGIFGHHTRYGKFLDLALPMALALTVVKDAMTRLLAFSFLILGGYSLVLTLSRGSWIGSGVGMLGVLTRLRRASIALAAAVGIAIVGLMVFPAKSNISKRFESLVHLEKAAKTEKSLTHRRDFYKTALVLIKERPILGWGYGRKTPKAIIKRKGLSWFQARKLRPFKSHAHNTYLEIALETGLIGLIAFLGLLLFSLMSCLKSHPREGEVFVIKTGAAFSVVALLVHGLVTNFFQQPFIFLFFLYLALLNSKAGSVSPS